MEAKEIEEKKNKLEEFFSFCFEDWLYGQLAVLNEPVHIVVLQKPEYNEYDKHFYAQGVLKIGATYHTGKYYTMKIEAGSKLIFVKSKALSLTLTWEQLEEEIKAREAIKHESNNI